VFFKVKGSTKLTEKIRSSTGGVAQAIC